MENNSDEDFEERRLAPSRIFSSRDIESRVRAVASAQFNEAVDAPALTPVLYLSNVTGCWSDDDAGEYKIDFVI